MQHSLVANAPHLSVHLVAMSEANRFKVTLSTLCPFCLFGRVFGLVYMAYPDGCQHEIFISAVAKALPHEEASALACVHLHVATAMCFTTEEHSSAKNIAVQT